MKNKKSNKPLFLVVDVSVGRTECSKSLSGVEKHIRRLSEMEGMDADDINDSIQVFEVKKKIIFKAHNTAAVKIKFSQ